MDERIEKAFEIANYMATFSNQRRLALEQFNQKLVYYINGATFKISPELITYTKTVIDQGYTEEVPFLDFNNLPIIISSVPDFLENISGIYFDALNEYAVKYGEIRTQRKVEGLVSL